MESSERISPEANPTQPILHSSLILDRPTGSTVLVKSPLLWRLQVNFRRCRCMEIAAIHRANSPSFLGNFIHLESRVVASGFAEGSCRERVVGSLCWDEGALRLSLLRLVLVGIYLFSALVARLLRFCCCSSGCPSRLASRSLADAMSAWSLLACRMSRMSRIPTCVATPELLIGESNSMA